jgi:hypothetical protein
VHALKNNEPKKVLFAYLSKGYIYKSEAEKEIVRSSPEYASPDHIYCICKRNTGSRGVFHENILPVPRRDNKNMPGYGLARWARRDFDNPHIVYGAPSIETMKHLYQVHVNNKRQMKDFMGKFFVIRYNIHLSRG